jgi:GT2 family glycosyltransferase
MVIRKNLFEEIGGFSDRYFMYGEDVDLCLRVRRKGFTNYHSLDITIIHYGGGTTPEVQKPLFSALMRQSLYTYFRTNHGRLTAIAFRTAIFLAGITRIGLLLAVCPLLTLAKNRYSVRHALFKWASICAWSLGILNPRKLLAKNPADP